MTNDIAPQPNPCQPDGHAADDRRPTIAPGGTPALSLPPAPEGLTARHLDRAAGVLLGAACGDALGVPYEFAPALPPARRPDMIGGGLGPYDPGEYSDDTQMQVCIARVAASGVDLRSATALDEITGYFTHWLTSGASDVGTQTSAVLRSVIQASNHTTSSAPPQPGLAAVARRAAAKFHRHAGRSAGNGSLMRTGIIALAYLRDADGLTEAARCVSTLTHYDDLAGDACVLWCHAIRTAVLDGTWFGLDYGLDHLPPERRDQWRRWIDQATALPPSTFTPNGFAVAALQAAWSAISNTPIPAEDPPQHLAQALENAVRAGDDTDTVAAIAGALLGAYWGASAIPPHWHQIVHGWPNMRAADLTDLAVRTATSAWSTAASR